MFKRVSQPKQIDPLLRLLGRKTIDENPQTSYFNERFRDYELAILNIKQIAHEIGRQYTKERLGRIVTEAPHTELASKLCTQADIESDWFAFWAREMKTAIIYQRKLWELCYVSQALHQRGMLKPGKRGLVFGCGEEPLPSLFVKWGCSVLATDLTPQEAKLKGWLDSRQHAGSLEKLKRREICPDDAALARIEHRFVDMNEIPRDLDGAFDFCWSACALEHLGSIQKGADFIENSLRTLKPGGIAVHTTEFNLRDGDTIDNWVTVLYQQKHIEKIVERLSRKGHSVAPVDFASGSGFVDGFVDLPPWSEATMHLKLSVDGFPCTSIGLIISCA